MTCPRWTRGSSRSSTLKRRLRPGVDNPDTLLLDTDFFVLVAGANLMAPLLDVLGCSPRNARRLHPLPFMLRKGALVRRYSAGVLQKAAAWCDRIGAIEDRPSTQLQQQLLEVVDPGEALLFASVAGSRGGVVATGDKRACVAVATSEGLAAVRPLLAGKVLCLERALALLLEHLGFEALAGSLVSVREFDRTLRLLLPEAEATSEAHFREGLDSYLTHLESQAGTLLVSFAER